LACGTEASSGGRDRGSDRADAAVDAGALSSVRPDFCAREDQDAVRDLFCADTPPDITSLRDLQTQLGLGPDAADRNAPYVGTPLADNPYSALGPVAVMSHSTSLSGALVSPLNPRVLVLGTSTLLAFVRGVQRVELISPSRTTHSFNFYLLSFEQACNDSDRTCTPGDLYTPRIESDWLRVRIHDGEQLKNTPQDCRQCHQRASEKPTLLMRELESPWTHFFVPSGLTGALPGVGGSDLMDDYLGAKGDEVYGGYDLSTISSVTPFLMQTRVGIKQPLYFDSSAILEERYPYGPDGYATEAQTSPTWERAYEAFKRGEQLAVPYFEQRATDPDKQRQLSEAYRSFRDGELDADELPDLADIYPDDPKLRARMGLQTEPDASAEEALIQACGSCHNDVLDQTISRARFNIDLSRMDRAALDRAIERIQRDRSAPGAMPPSEARQLDPSAAKRLVAYLRRDPASREPDPRLERAARLGMSGGGVTIQVLR
jgi:cytochrome c553